MPEWKGKTRGGVFGHKFFVLFIKHLGLKPAYVFLKIIAIYFLIFSDKRYIYFFFNKILKFSTFKSIYSIFLNYCSLGEVLIDKMALLAGFKSNFTYNFDGENHLRGMKDGGILISAHLGNWEIAGQLLERLETRFNIVMYDAEHEKIKKYLNDVLIKKNFNVIVMKDDLSHIYKINEALNNKELVCFHGDRFVEGSKKVLCNFLGENAYFPAGPFYLVSRFNVPVTFVFAFKETKSHYHFYATDVKTYNFSGRIKDRDNNISMVIKDYLTELEAKVKLFPTQWFNYHKFWESE